MYIESTLKKFNDNSLPDNFVSIAVNISKETLEPFHAAILIRYQKADYLHHFPGSLPPTIIENFNETGWYIYKIVESFNIEDESEIGSFLQYCRRICERSEITYSYIADGSSYDDRGKFISKIGLPEFGTCVGFCINTLTNALIDVDDSIISLEDWDDSGLDKFINDWSERMSKEKYPDLDWTLYNAFKKRITPLEYLCTSYFKEYPIKKAAIDEIKLGVLEEIKQFYPQQENIDE